MELNFSCPHAEPGYGSTIGENLELASRYVRFIKANTAECRAPLFVKLTPNVNDIASIAKAVVEAERTASSRSRSAPPAHRSRSEETDSSKQAGRQRRQSGNRLSDRLKAITEIGSARRSDPDHRMGGVDSGADAAKLIGKMSSNRIRLGTVDQRLASVPKAIKKREPSSVQRESPHPSVSFIKTHRQMEYQHIVLEKKPTADTTIFGLTASFPPRPGSSLFVAAANRENPSGRHNDPLTFVIKRRGPFSDELCRCRRATRCIRGLYGQGFDPENKKPC